MTREELIRRVAADSKLTTTAVRVVLDEFELSVAKALQEGHTIPLRGIGRLSVADRAAREGRDPRNGALLSIPARRVLKIKQSSELKL